MGTLKYQVCDSEGCLVRGSRSENHAKHAKTRRIGPPRRARDQKTRRASSLRNAKNCCLHTPSNAARTVPHRCAWVAQPRRNGAHRRGSNHAHPPCAAPMRIGRNCPLQPMARAALRRRHAHPKFSGGDGDGLAQPLAYFSGHQLYFNACRRRRRFSCCDNKACPTLTCSSRKVHADGAGDDLWGVLGFADAAATFR